MTEAKLNDRAPIWEFQFLIGKIMTLTEKYTKVWHEEFQFLIGKIMTIRREHDYFLLARFQFLIGKIMTEYRV